MITYSELEKADVSDLPIRKRVGAFYKGTDAIAKFVEKELIEILRSQLNLNDKEKAIIGTYLRMYAYLRSMVAMNHRIHFQGAASATRSLFELLLDMKMIAEDNSGELINKFHAFPKVSETTPVFLGIIKLQLRHGNLHGRREAVGRLEPMEIKIEKGAKIVRFRE